MDHIRIWSEVDISAIDGHLVIVDDLHGFCNACRKTGLRYGSLKRCPECGTTFTHATTRDASHVAHIINKLKKNDPELVIIDYNDYKHLSDKKKAGSLFSIGNEE